MKDFNRSWTDADIERVKGLIKQNKGAREIGVLLGKTRNAVIGMCHRKKIAFSSTPLRYKDPPRKKSPPIRPAVFELKFEAIMKNRKPTSCVFIADLKDDMCREVIGEPKDGFFCGQPTVNEIYCTAHHAKNYEKMKPKRIFIPIPEVVQIQQL